jgi:hypothetical protein
MTSKMIALRVLDRIIMAMIGILMLSISGVPTDWLSDLLNMSAREFRGFSIFVVFAALWVMHAIATSDSAP